MVDGVGESRDREILTARPFGVPIDKVLIASPARRRATNLLSRATATDHCGPSGHEGRHKDRQVLTPASVVERGAPHPGPFGHPILRPSASLDGTRDEDSTEGPEDVARGHVASRPAPPR